MNKHPEIAPCPYCPDGGKVDCNDNEKESNYIFCGECGIDGPIKPNYIEAISAWNLVANRTVRVPEEREIAKDEEDDNMAHFVQGFNLCLSEIKRLNPHLKFEEQ